MVKMTRDNNDYQEEEDQSQKSSDRLELGYVPRSEYQQNDPGEKPEPVSEEKYEEGSEEDE